MTDKVIGIYSIFIGKYILYYKKFIDNVTMNFLPEYNKIFYIVTDDPKLPKYHEHTVFYNTEFIGWPYETLYRFKYFLKFDNVEADIIYFLNANICCMKPITDVLPDDRKYVFTEHYCQRGDYDAVTFDKNPISTAYIPFDSEKKYNYIGGGFYGAPKSEFINMCKHLNKNIEIDERKGYIALWHDESHINNFCNVFLNNNVKFLDITYHMPEVLLYKNQDSTNLLYFNKDKSMNVDAIKVNYTNGNIIKNKYNKRVLTKFNNLKTVYISPDHNPKYHERKEHMEEMLKSIGIENFVHYKSGADKYPKCLIDATIDILKNNMEEPILILEDDIEFTGVTEFDFPENIDAIYFGLSTYGGHPIQNKDMGNFSSTFEPYSENQVRVLNMLSAHAILYISPSYKQAVNDILLSINDPKYHSDVLISRIQPKFQILANKKPSFYQATKYNNGNLGIESCTNISFKRDSHSLRL